MDPTASQASSESGATIIPKTEPDVQSPPEGNTTSLDISKMIRKAVLKLQKQPTGASLRDVKKYVGSTFSVNVVDKALEFKLAIKRAMNEGTLVRADGKYTVATRAKRPCPSVSKKKASPGQKRDRKGEPKKAGRTRRSRSGKHPAKPGEQKTSRRSRKTKK